jgi:hypothetical protein
VNNVNQDAVRLTMKKGAAALREAGIPFVLGGGVACWARGLAGHGRDVDFMVRPDDAEAALKTLEDAGMEPKRPPEGWLFKARDGDVVIDVIFRPAGLEMSDEVIERGDELEVEAVPMRVMAATDVMVTKLMALSEHHCDYEAVLEISRALREQLDWDDLRCRTEESPFAAAFFTLVERLGIAPSVDEAVRRGRAPGDR